MLIVTVAAFISLSLGTVNPGARLFVGPQLQGGNITTVQALQPTVQKPLQSPVIILGPSTHDSVLLQPAIGDGLNGFSLQ